MTIKLIDAREQPSYLKEVVLEFRRHSAAQHNPTKANIFYIVAPDPTSRNTSVYPIRIDGDTQVVTVRRSDWEKLGFKVEVI